MKHRDVIAASVFAAALMMSYSALAQTAETPPAGAQTETVAPPPQSSVEAPAPPEPGAAPAAQVDASASPPAPGEIGSPPTGKAQIVFYRPSRLTGAALSFTVHENGKGVAKLVNGSYFAIAAEPGLHEYSTQYETKDVLRIELEPDETYYVQQTIGMGVVGARPHLAPSDKAAFAAKKLKLSTKTPTDIKEKDAP